jgi:hypothetical protein
MAHQHICEIRHKAPTRHILSSFIQNPAAYDKDMNELIINVSWEYFVGIIGSLIALAYYANGRFTRLETSVEWLKDSLRGFNITSENRLLKLYKASSPVALTSKGNRVLKESGLEAYVDTHKNELIARAKLTRKLDRYEIQSRSFHLFAELQFEEAFEHRLKEYAFESGMSTQYLRRLGGLHFRDLVVATS